MDNFEHKNGNENMYPFQIIGAEALNYLVNTCF